jgi:kinesin family protein C2/C3
MAGPFGSSPCPSEQEFVASLRNGIVLCNAINKLHPGAVPKVVTNAPCDSQPSAAFQYFENIRNFLVAVQDLKLPSFEASDLDKVTNLLLIKRKGGKKTNVRPWDA